MANEYINKVVANNNTLIDLTGDTAEAADVLEGRTLHLASGAPATGTYRPSDEIEARLKATVGHSCKNLLVINRNTQIINGIAFTVDKENGLITANGTASAQSQFSIRLNNIPSGNYYFSGCADNGSINKYEVYAFDITTNKRMKKWDGITNSASDFGGTSQEIKVISTNTQQITIRIYSGVTVSNAVFRLMLRDGRISDDTFEPYATPTDERIVALEARVAALEAALNR